MCTRDWKSGKQTVSMDIYHLKPVSMDIYHLKPVSMDIYHFKPVSMDIYHLKPVSMDIYHPKPLCTIQRLIIKLCLNAGALVAQFQ